MQNSTTPEALENLGIYKSYKKSKFLSIKLSSYFQVYEELFNKFVGKQFTFVEIGVLNGGSLFMWRDYFGEQARIIGVDFNPDAKRWEADGFEIFTGDQSDPNFWDNFFSTVGNVDVILDDGGHTNRQQIVTTDSCIPNINDGGLLVIEDVHTSYFRAFGNPSKYSFISFAKSLVDRVNSRFPGVSASSNKLGEWVYSVSFFESIVCFHIDKRKSFVSTLTTNEGINVNAEDFRHKSSANKGIAQIQKNLSTYFGFLKKFRFLKEFGFKVFTMLNYFLSKKDTLKVKKYFN